MRGGRDLCSAARARWRAPPSAQAAGSLPHDERGWVEPVVLLVADRDDCPIAQGRDGEERVGGTARVWAVDDCPARSVPVLNQRRRTAPGGEVACANGPDVVGRD